MVSVGEAMPKTATHAQMMRSKAAKSMSGFHHETCLRKRPARSQSRKVATTNYATSRDVRYSSAPSFTFGGRYGDEVDTLASNSPFFQHGTHRCPQGEELTDVYGRRDDKHLKTLKALGRQWKATPGPGSYRTPRSLGSIEKGPDKTDLDCRRMSHSSVASWSIGRSLRTKFWHTTGGQTMNPGEPPQQHDETIASYMSRCSSTRPPTPRHQREPTNMVPGPGHYHRRCSSAPSLFSDFHRPQGHAYNC